MKGKELTKKLEPAPKNLKLRPKSGHIKHIKNINKDHVKVAQEINEEETIPPRSNRDLVLNQTLLDSPLHQYTNQRIDTKGMDDT